MDNVKTVKELSNYKTTATFYDEDGSLVTPSRAVSYRVVDSATGTVVVAETPVTVTASSVDIVIPAASNTCISPGSQLEYRQVIIKAVGLAQTEHVFAVLRVPSKVV